MKPRLTLEISTEGINETLDQIEKGLEEAIEQAADNTRDAGLEAAQHHIRTNDRVWNREVLNAWHPFNYTSGGAIRYGFVNQSKHAAAVDEGATYTDRMPPRDALIPWVRDKLSHWPGTVEEKATMLQHSIFEEGLQGIDYITVAEVEMESVAPGEIKKEVRKQFSEPV